MAENNEDKNTGKYIDILNICANKENLDGSQNTNTAEMKTQFTAEEFNGIVRALQELYAATSTKEFREIWLVNRGDSAGSTSKSLTVKKGDTVTLDFSYIYRERIGFGNWTMPGDSCHFTIKYKKSGTAADAQVIYDSKTAGENGTEKPLVSGVDFSLDITNYLSGGKFEFIVDMESTSKTTVEDETVKLKRTFYYYVTFTDMSLEFQNDDIWWTKAYEYKTEQGANNIIPLQFRVGGSGSRRVVISVSGSGITSATYSAKAGDGMADLSYDVPFPNRDTIMNISAYVCNDEDDTVKTDPIVRQCMIVKANPASRTVKLMAINNLQTLVKGGESRQLFSYAVYDSTSTNGYTDVLFKVVVDKDGEQTTDNLQRDNTAFPLKHTLEYDLSNIEANAETYYLKVSATDLKGTKKFLNETTITVDNKTSFSATTGAVWFMNPVGRTNTEARHEDIKNSIDNTYYSAVWNNFSWSLNDAWCTAEETDLYGGKAKTSFLRIPSGSSVNIAYTPLKTGATGVRTIEFDYLVRNISDYTLPVIDITSPRGGDESDRLGIKVYPGKVCTSTRLKPDDISRQIATDDNVRLRVTVSLTRNQSYVAGQSTNFVRIYINGIIAKVYEIESTDSMDTGNQGNIILGSQGADIDIYGIRVYNSGLTNAGIAKNYINRLMTTTEKTVVQENNDVLSANGSSVDFLNTVDQYNVFVFDGPTWPSYISNTKPIGNLELYSIKNVGGKVGNSLKITNVEAKGQGTSSKSYWEWNLQFGTKKNTEFWPIYQNGSGQWVIDDLGEDTGETRGRVNKDGDPVNDAEGNQIMDPVYSKVTYKNKVPMFEGVPKAKKIVMKKNWASSMQDHKIGSVNSFTDAWKEMGLSNPATLADDTVRVSVYQEPMLGFWKKVDSFGDVTYEFKGLFTGGPHKGDDDCFGYDTDEWPDLISIEGSDNGAAFANFQVPWAVGSSHVKYVGGDVEALQYDGVTSWDFAVGVADSDTEDPKEIEAILNQFNRCFQPAYTIAYECSQNITPFEGTYDELVQAVSNRSISLATEYWTNDYKLWHIFSTKNEEGSITSTTVESVDTGAGQINLKEDLKDYVCNWYYTSSAGSKTYAVPTKIVDGKSVPQPKTIATIEGFDSLSASEKNEYFKKARLQKFRDESEKQWDIDDSIFQACWVEFFAGTDQRAKNTYPYSYQVKDGDGNLTPEGKWKWRLDDADTIGPIDNGGTISKGYDVEVHDKKEEGGFYWNGEGNVFFNLLEDAWADRYYKSMRLLLGVFEELSELTEGTESEKIYAFYKKYFLNVKKYFPEVLYNSDSERYETAFQQIAAKKYENQISPLNQSLGNGYSPESAWYKKRIQYISSKYAFGDYALNARGNSFSARIFTEDEGTLELTMTPNLTHYPVIEFGTSVLAHSVRCFEGVPHTFNLSLGSNVGDQIIYIHGASQFSDLGDLHKMNLNAGYEPNFSSFSSIKELNLGFNKPSEVKHAAATIHVPASLNKLYLENYNKLTTIGGLTTCTRLMDIDATNTKVTNFTFANGAPLVNIKYPATVQNLVYQNCKDLKYENIVFAGTDNINTINISNTPGVAGISLTKDIIESQNKLSSRALRYVNLQGVDENFVGQESVKVLELLNDLTDPTKGYYGIDSLGIGSEDLPPTITGKIGVEFSYEDTENSLETFFKGLDITVGTYYIRFKDTENLEPMLKDYMVACGWMKATETISTENAKSLTSFTAGGSSIFRENGLITSFDELKYFTSYTSVAGSYNWTSQKTDSDFYGCENLRSINLENIVSIGEGGFEASGIETVYAPKLNSLSQKAFFGCKNLKAVQSLGTVSTINANTFEGCSSLTTIILPKECTKINESAFAGCTSLRSIYLPNNLVELGNNMFNNCTSLETIYWNYTGQGTPSAPSQGGFGPSTKIIYVNQSMFTRINAVTSWKPFIGLVQVYDFDKDPNKAIPEELKK